MASLILGFLALSSDITLSLKYASRIPPHPRFFSRARPGIGRGFSAVVLRKSLAAASVSNMLPSSTETSKDGETRRTRRKEEGGKGGGGKLRKVAASADHERFELLVQHASAAELDECCDASGKNPLHHAAWRGHVKNVCTLLDKGMDVNRWSTGTHNYGKTAIFYALTRSREDVVELLLQRGARVRVVNNKGQTPRSIAYSHLDERYVDMISKREEEEEEEEREGRREGNGEERGRGFTGSSWSGWKNFRETHSDGIEYGDVDPRFSSVLEIHNQTEFAINPTTPKSRRKRREQLRSSATGVSASPEVRGKGGDDDEGGVRNALSMSVSSLIESYMRKVRGNLMGLMEEDKGHVLKKVDLLVSLSMLERAKTSWLKLLRDLLVSEVRSQHRQIGQSSVQVVAGYGDESLPLPEGDQEKMRRLYEMARHDDVSIDEQTLRHELDLTKEEASAVLRTCDCSRVKKLRVRVIRHLLVELSCSLPDRERLEKAKKEKKDKRQKEISSSPPSSLLLHDESHALATSCNLSPFIVPLETVQWVQDALGLIRIKQTLQTLIVHLEVQTHQLSSSPPPPPVSPDRPRMQAELLTSCAGDLRWHRHGVDKNRPGQLHLYHPDRNEADGQKRSYHVDHRCACLPVEHQRN
eukprot:768779-Hanusia_phi.AAC.1